MREKGSNSETHAANALNALFYQEQNFFNSGRANIPANWSGLEANMPILTALVTEAPGSGYLASLFLNLVEPSPRGALLPFVLKAITAWCEAYGVDPNFWSEKGVGLRVCGWLDRTFTADPASLTALGNSIGSLTKCLDILVQSGVAQATEIEERIANASPRGRLSSADPRLQIGEHDRGLAEAEVAAPSDQVWPQSLDDLWQGFSPCPAGLCIGVE
jgi:hypothetical protein